VEIMRRNLQEEIMELNILADKDWRDNVLEDLSREGYIAIESFGILTEKDIRVAMNAIKQNEENRDETEEWKHINELKAARASEGGSN
jgi:hypothetical protein